MGLCGGGVYFVFCNALLLLLERSVHGSRSQQLISPESCDGSEYFDSTRLVCQKCGDGQLRSLDGFGCQCARQHRRFATSNDTVIRCVTCPSEEAVSEDGWNCVQCVPSTRFDNTTARCSPCQAGAIKEEHWDGKAWLQTCVPCEAPYWPDATGIRCVRCPHDFLLSSNGKCKCGEKFTEIGGACIPTKDLLPAESSLFTLTFQNEQKVKMAFLQEHLQAAFYNCQTLGNDTACQVLANQCVFVLYRTNESPLEPTACSEYLRLAARTAQKRISAHVPWLFYQETSPAQELARTDVPTHFSMGQNFYHSFLNLTVIGYDSSGKYEGIRPFSSVLTQMCRMSNDEMRSSFSFAVNFRRTCKLSSTELWENANRLTFYDLYLCSHENGHDVLYPVPILVRNLISKGQKINAGEDVSKWQLARRFFLADSRTEGNPIRYLASISIRVRVIDDDESSKEGFGRIHPPLLVLEYAESSVEQFQSNSLIQVNLSVDYVMEQSETFRHVSIALGVLGGLCVIWALFSTWGWAKRAGKENIDFLVVCRFVVLLFGALSDAFLMVLVVTALNWLVLFKSQDAVHLLLPNPEQESSLLACLVAAFVMKTIRLLVMLVDQCTVNVFFVDWEQPTARRKNASGDGGVSVWRTYHVANEWNELQTVRRVPLHAHLFLVLICLKVVGLESLALSEPRSRLSGDETRFFIAVSTTALFAVSAATFLCLALLQAAICRLFYEHFIRDRLQQFVDLCSVCNISLFLATDIRYGFYVHGRSAHGRADVDMKEMHKLLCKEEEDLCGHRGLLPDTEQQTFTMCLPSGIHEQYARLLLPLTSYGQSMRRMQGVGGRLSKVDIDHMSDTYQMLNRFFAGFIEHAYKDLDYVVRDRLFLEKLFDLEFSHTQDKGHFYNDGGHSFDAVLFCGQETTLLTFELLLFSIIIIATTDVVLATVLTFFISKIIERMRKSAGRKNIVRKALLDQRFLK